MDIRHRCFTPVSTNPASSAMTNIGSTTTRVTAMNTNRYIHQNLWHDRRTFCPNDRLPTPLGPTSSWLDIPFSLAMISTMNELWSIMLLFLLGTLPSRVAFSGIRRVENQPGEAKSLCGSPEVLECPRLVASDPHCPQIAEVWVRNALTELRHHMHMPVGEPRKSSFQTEASCCACDNGILIISSQRLLAGHVALRGQEAEHRRSGRHPKTA